MTDDAEKKTVVVEMPKKNGSMLLADPNYIIAREEMFPGAAAAAELLMPYFQQALKASQLTMEASSSHAAQANRVPETTLKEARANLTALQTSGLSAQISGDTALAEEIRNVASNLRGMMKTIEQMCIVSKPGAGRSHVAGDDQ